MTYTIAKNRIFTHGAAVRLFANSPDWENCFLGMLRPYHRPITSAVFEDILECLRVIYPPMRTSETIDRQVAAGVQGILHYGRRWVLDPNSELRKSGKMSAEQIASVERWLNVIDDVYTEMLWFTYDESHIFGKFLTESLARHSVEPTAKPSK